ncbi:hypothetical protein RR48_00299 [Papilio machaon]|uniref:Uncharacterized protein n=1 Tax=Papilio machaon TaxID=76193 RepID=A0A0N1PI43_PAPMA|nr:hypothetical protein RR48_00299 [Papilio machaon]
MVWCLNKQFLKGESRRRAFSSEVQGKREPAEHRTVFSNLELSTRVTYESYEEMCHLLKNVHTIQVAEIKMLR